MSNRHRLEELGCNIEVKQLGNARILVVSHVWHGVIFNNATGNVEQTCAQILREKFKVSV